MSKYLCKTEEELNYIIKKYDCKYSHFHMDTIIRNLNIKGYIFLSKDFGEPSFCSGYCNNCGFSLTCSSYQLHHIYASHIMREEKLNRILND